MPLNRDAYSRYRLIDERLRRKPSPSLEVLISYVSEALDKKVSARTIQYDLQEMRYSQSLKFEAPIGYDRSARTYSYTRSDYSIHTLPVNAEDLHGLEFAISILDQFKELPAIKEFEDAIHRIADTVQFNKESRGEKNIIQFDRSGSYQGLHYLEPAVLAIREQRRVHISYRRFGESSSKAHVIEPYLVREFRSRFYLIGNVISSRGEKVLTFAFDRIEDMQVSDTSFDGAAFDSDQYYQSVYGITAGDTHAEEILLAFTPLQAKYIQSQPLHSSQQIIKETNTETRIKIQVGINTELLMQLLSYGANVRVLKPKSLADKIKVELQKNLHQYE
jgi:predicted DNA-binding transcriptional regulator YafY